MNNICPSFGFIFQAVFKHGQLKNQESVSNDKEESGRIPDFLAEKNGLNINIHRFLTSESSEKDDRIPKFVKT